MQTLEKLPTVTLYYREASSDKVYQCAIEPAGERYVVNFAYGRRGSTLNTGTKTNVPVEYMDAKRIFDKLVKEKTAKGYTPGENGTPYQHSEKQPSGLLPQLLNSIEESRVLDLMNDDAWCCQEKFDGRRLIIQKQGRNITGINKKGNLIGLPEPLFQAINQYSADVVIDGESIGDNYYAFDLLNLDGVDIREWPYRERLAALLNLLAGIQQRVIKFVDTAFTTSQKLAMLETLKQGRKEGIVFKQLHSATDLDSFVTYTTEQPQPGQPLDVLLPFEQLNKMVKGCGGEVVVSPELKDKAKIRYQLGDNSLEQSVNTLSVKEFPPSPKITEKPVPMPVQFGETLRQAFDTSSSDSSRYVLQGAYLDVEQAKCHSIVSTNGRALFAANTFTFGLKESVNIAKSKFLAWSGFLEGECGLTVQPNKQNGGYVQFTTSRWNCISKQIEGKFPNWRQVVPNDTEVWTRIILSEAATNQILTLSNKLPGGDDQNRTIQLRIGRDLYLEGKGKDDKEFTTAVISGVTITGKHITTALNREYLQSALRCGLTEIRVSSELEPLVFCSAGKKMVVMPVRLQGPVTTQGKPAKPASTPANESATTTTEPERKTDMAKETKTEAVKTAETTTLIDQIEQIREVMKNTVRDLGNLIDAVKLAEKEKRASEKEVEAARSVLKKLQQVTI